MAGGAMGGGRFDPRATALAFYIDKGYSPEQAAGFVSRLNVESGMNPRIWGDKGTSYGLAQVRKERLHGGAGYEGLIPFARKAGASPSDFFTQLEYTDSEMRPGGPEARAGGMLRRASNSTQAAGAAMAYERPKGFTWSNPFAGMHADRTVAGARELEPLARDLKAQAAPADPSAGAGGYKTDAAIQAHEDRQPIGAPITDNSPGYQSDAAIQAHNDREQELASRADMPAEGAHEAGGVDPEGTAVRKSGGLLASLFGGDEGGTGSSGGLLNSPKMQQLLLSLALIENARPTVAGPKPIGEVMKPFAQAATARSESEWKRLLMQHQLGREARTDQREDARLARDDQRFQLEESRYQATNDLAQERLKLERDKASRPTYQNVQRNGETTTLEIRPGEEPKPVELPGTSAEPANPYANPGAAANLNESQAQGFADRMFESEGTLRKLGDAVGSNPVDKAASSVPYVGNYLVSKEFQQYDAARRNFINAQLRRESGATIRDDEFLNAERQYFPQPGEENNAEVIAQKKQARRTAIEGMARAGGRSYRPGFVFDETGQIVPYGKDRRAAGAPAAAPPAAAPPAAARPPGAFAGLPGTDNTVAAPAAPRAPVSAPAAAPRPISPRLPAEPGGSSAAPPATIGGIEEGRTATNPQTGEKVIFRGGRWQPVQ